MESLADRFIPRPDFFEVHETVVDAPPQRAFAAARELGLRDLKLARPLFAARGLISRLLHGRANVDMPDFGEPIAEDPPREIVLGVVGQWWKIGGSANRTDVSGPDAFLAFDEPGYAKATFGFRFVERPDGRTRAITETRVLCTDPEARRTMARYWRVIRPGSGLVRRLILRELRKRAEAG